MFDSLYDDLDGFGDSRGRVIALREIDALFKHKSIFGDGKSPQTC